MGNAVWFFRQNGEHVCRYRFLVAIAWRLQPIVYASDEAIFHERSLTIVRRGLVFHSRRLLTRGQTFGDDMLLNAPELINKEAALSLTVVLSGMRQGSSDEQPYALRSYVCCLLRHV